MLYGLGVPDPQAHFIRKSQRYSNRPAEYYIKLNGKFFTYEV